MSGQQNENAATAAGRTEMEDLPQPEKELTADEAKDVKGGLLLPAVQSVREASKVAAGPGGGPHAADKNICSLGEVEGNFGGVGDVNKKFGDGSV